ncbi:MAG: glycogen/starch synthase [Muribaculaceae bacterium]|nr:glycogen/starch synthase [Muribaculaceae bacterium]
MDIKKVLYVTQELDPYLPATPMGEYGHNVALALQSAGAEVRTFMPKYGIINERRHQLHEVIRLSGLNIIIDDTDHPLIIKVATLQPTRLQVYFIDNDDYFFRSNDATLETVSDHENNGERSMFFIRGVYETVKKLRWEPSLVQCTGWLTALMPLYLRKLYADDPAFNRSTIAFTLYNDAFEGTLDERLAEKLIEQGFEPEQVEAFKALDWLALNKIAIDNADVLVAGAKDIPAELIDYATASGKPFLRFDPEKDNAQACAEFFKSL